MDVLAPLHFVPLLAWLALAAISLALLEIQVEGVHGWAASLPTWRYGPPWIRRLLNGKDLTGYHLFLWLLLLVLFHLPLLFVAWSVALELTLLSAFATFAVLWDAPWFGLNPAVGRGRRDRRRIAWWFRRWIGPFPTDYYLGLMVGALLATIRGALPGAPLEPAFGTMPSSVQHLVGWFAGLVVASAIGGGVVLLRRTVRPSRPLRSYLVDSTEAAARAAGAGPGERLVIPPSAGLDPRPLRVPGLRDVPVVAVRDPLVELVEQEERLRKAQWLIQFAEILFGIVIGLSLQRIGSSNLFTLAGRRWARSSSWARRSSCSMPGSSST